MTDTKSNSRCAIYTRKSSEEGLDQAFNSLHAQREACEAYVLSQKHEGWKTLPDVYDDGGFSGGNMERPGLKKLLADISAGKIDTVVVYKVDRLTRSLSDFARIVESFDGKGVSFVSVTQQFNTTSSMGRLTLNVLLSFAQFEREVTGERIRDKIAASKKKGMWMGGPIPLGYDLANRQLVKNEEEAKTVRMIFERYLEIKNVADLQEELKRTGIRSKSRVTAAGSSLGGAILCRGTLYHLLSNPIYVGKTRHKGAIYEGKHEAILDDEIWKAASALLDENTVARRNHSNLPSGRMLHGKLQTEGGSLYTPTHCSKGGRRYFYYALTVKSDEHARDVIRRLPAAEIEKRVLHAICSFLTDPLRMADEFPSLPVRDTKLLVSAAHHRATVLREGTGREKTALIIPMISRVVLAQSQLLIELDRAAIVRELLGTDLATDITDPVLLAEPYSIARRGSEVRMILTSKDRSTEEPIPTLVRAVSQAKTWYQWIIKGEINNKRDLAKRTGLNENYVARILRLVTLSPDLTDAILKGDHPPMLTVAQLTERVAIDWKDQRLSPYRRKHGRRFVSNTRMLKS